MGTYLGNWDNLYEVLHDFKLSDNEKEEIIRNYEMPV